VDSNAGLREPFRRAPDGNGDLEPPEETRPARRAPPSVPP